MARSTRAAPDSPPSRWQRLRRFLQPPDFTDEAKNARVSYSRDLAVTRLTADERRLKQMLVNLLSNAVKFTPASGALGLDVQGDAARQEVRSTV